MWLSRTPTLHIKSCWIFFSSYWVFLFFFLLVGSCDWTKQIYRLNAVTLLPIYHVEYIGCQSLSFCARYFLAFLAKNPKNFFAYFVQFLTFCFLFISTKVQSIEHVTSIPHSECLNRKATLLSCMTIFDILRLQLRDDQL